MNIVNHATWTISREAAISHADPWALKYVPGAWDGDVEASSSLASALSNANRGAFAVLMWRGKVKREAFRSFLRKAWDHDHVEVIAASENRRTLAAMFRHAAFEVPVHLGERFPVWRGTCGVYLAAAQKGFSWTADRDVAAWFAMRNAGAGRQPLVIRAEILAADVAMYADERSERECLLVKAPKSARIDGDLNDWREAFDRQAQVQAGYRREAFEALGQVAAAG